MLEFVLMRYTAVCAGDTLVLNYRNQEFRFDILSCLPAKAIQLIDADVAVEFAPPLSGEEIPKNVEEEKATTAPAPSAAASAPPSLPAFKSGSLLDNPPGQENVDWKRCPTCRKGIPVASFDRHTLPCSRLNVWCELCGGTVEKSSVQQHMQSQHAMVFCNCGAEVESRFLQRHEQNDCVLRERQCKFCSLSFQHSELFAHENACGSKTEMCSQCNKYIRIRDLVGHDNVCGVEDVDVAPRGGGDDDWGGVVGGGGGGGGGGGINNLFPCSYCHEPFEAFDDLEVHMLVSHPELMEQQEQKEQKKQDVDEKPFVFDPPENL